MKEVLVLNIRYAPDWPNKGGWKTEVHATIDSVVIRLDQLRQDPLFIEYNFDTYEVREIK
jgi:hypothetical protein